MPTKSIMDKIQGFEITHNNFFTVLISDKCLFAANNEEIKELIEYFIGRKIAYALVSTIRKSELEQKLKMTGLSEFFNEENSFYPGMWKQHIEETCSFGLESGIDLDNIDQYNTGDTLYAMMKLGSMPEECVGLGCTFKDLRVFNNVLADTIFYTDGQAFSYDKNDHNIENINVYPVGKVL